MILWNQPVLQLGHICIVSWLSQVMSQDVHKEVKQNQALWKNTVIIYKNINMDSIRPIWWNIHKEKNKKSLRHFDTVPQLLYACTHMHTSIVCIMQHSWSNNKLIKTHFSGDSWIMGVSKLKRMYAAESVIKIWKNINNHIILSFITSISSFHHLFLSRACSHTHTHTHFHTLPFGILNFLSFLNHSLPLLLSTILTGNSISRQSDGFSVKSLATGRRKNKNRKTVTHTHSTRKALIIQQTAEQTYELIVGWEVKSRVQREISRPQLTPVQRNICKGKPKSKMAF